MGRVKIKQAQAWRNDLKYKCCTGRNYMEYVSAAAQSEYVRDFQKI